jgi:hypothetical protein
VTEKRRPETQGCIPVVPSFWGEVRLRWRGVATRSPPMPQRLTLFSGEQATEASSFPLSGGIGGTDQNPYTEVGAQLRNSIGGSQQENHKAFTRRKLWGDLSCPRQVPRRRSEANKNHFGRIVDLGLLSQSSKSWGIWLAREGDLRSWSSALMEERECGRGNSDLR